MSKLSISFTKLPTHLKHLYFDGDLLVYIIGFAVEEKIEWPDGTVDHSGDLNLAKRLLDNRIRSLMSSLPEGVTFQMVLTGDGPGWRHKIDSTYKAGRGRKPIDYKGIRAYLRQMDVVHETFDGLEADDYLAARMSEDQKNSVTVSYDKDYFTAPGHFLHLSMNGPARLYRINPQQALSFLWFQSLAGDRVDAYKGVDYIGRTKAAKLLWYLGHSVKEDGTRFTVRQALLFLKECVKRREAEQRKKGKLTEGTDLWGQFRTCIDLAALTHHGEVPAKGIGLKRIWKHRSELFEYFLPYYDPDHTSQYGKRLL